MTYLGVRMLCNYWKLSIVAVLVARNHCEYEVSAINELSQRMNQFLCMEKLIQIEWIRYDHWKFSEVTVLLARNMVNGKGCHPHSIMMMMMMTMMTIIMMYRSVYRSVPKRVFISR